MKVIKQSVDFEVTLTQRIKQSERRAWIVASVAAILVVMLGIAIMLLLPLKERVPYLVMADPYTGTSSLAKLTESEGYASVTSNEALNKSNVSKFITARESYDWDLSDQSDWIVVHAMGASSVVQAYRGLFEKNNPDNPNNIYGQSKLARVKIKSIILGKNGQNIYNFATVRFDKLIYNKVSFNIESAASFVATLAFEYKSNLAMVENHRIMNPLGFRVNSYRVDPEFAPKESQLILKEITDQQQRTGLTTGEVSQ